jgi:hypothetical protein
MTRENTMFDLRGWVMRFMSLSLLATSVGVTLILIILGYELALWILENGHVQGLQAQITLAGMPSLCALVSLPFWLTLRRLNSSGGQDPAN